METALQVNLAKPEAPAAQVLQSPLGSAVVAKRVSPSTSPTRQRTTKPEKKPIKGATETTSQIRLAPKASRQHRSQSQETSLNSLEFGEPSGKGSTHVLQPVDEGFGAWSYVASAFAMYIVVWGFPQSFPIFQTYLSSGDFAQHSDSVILPLLAPGLQDIEEGIMFHLLPKASRYRQTIVIVGILFMVAAIMLASYSSSAWQIVLTQGILFGIGGILLNFVHVSIFPEWFDKKKGQAMGIIWLGYRAGGLAFPPICQWLLDTHGFEKTLRVLLAPMLALLVPSVLLLRGRYSAATVISSSTGPGVSKITALRTPKVLFYLVVSIFFSLVTNVPMMFITKFGNDLQLDSSDQALSLSFVFASNILGTYLCGWLSDKLLYRHIMGVCAIAASLVHFLVWGFVKGKIGLFLYALCIGLTSGGFRNCFFSFYSEISGGNSDLFTAIHSVFSLFGGIAILSVGPVGTALLNLTPQINHEEYAIGKYKYLVAYAGAMTMASGLLVSVPLVLAYAKRFL